MMPSASSVRLLDYDFPDAGFLSFGNVESRWLVWQPRHVCVVIGRGSALAAEVHTENVAADQIPVYQRPSGGCAVVLTPKMFVASFGLYTTTQLSSKEYFARFTNVLVRALESLGVRDLSFRGISDIAIRDRKIAGTALYRNRERVFYHAVINVADSTDLMERYIQFPPRTPDYRLNRPHSDFVTSLMEQGFSIDLADFSAAVMREFDSEHKAMRA